MLEIAHLWQVSGYQPQRSVCFAAWGAQELGEVGSRYYLKNPLYPLENTVALVQLDAVAGGEAYRLDSQGRRENEGLWLYSISHAEELLGGRLQLSFPKDEGLQPFSPDALFDRDRIGIFSDHDPFRDVGIPALRIAWREAAETNLDDALADPVEPDRLASAGKMTVLSIVMNAR
jgi:Zn-dependent M28 family amino/carboxypeptidase